MHDEITEIMKEAKDYKTPTKNETKAIDNVNKKIKKGEKSKSDTKIDLTNYGPRVLYIIEEGENGESTIKINREHKAYKLWSNTELGKKYYTVMMYALSEAIKKMTHAEQKRFMNDFSEFLGKKSVEILE